MRGKVSWLWAFFVQTHPRKNNSERVKKTRGPINLLVQTLQPPGQGPQKIKTSKKKSTLNQKKDEGLCANQTSQGKGESSNKTDKLGETGRKKLGKEGRQIEIRNQKVVRNASVIEGGQGGCRG